MDRKKTAAKQQYCIYGLEGWELRAPSGAKHEIQVLDRFGRSKHEGYLFGGERELVINNKPVPIVILEAAERVRPGEFLRLDCDGNEQVFSMDVYQ